MGYYVSNMIGIRTGGVFGGDVDVDNMRSRIQRLVNAAEECAPYLNEEGDPVNCLSKELTATKGSYVVLAGVFNCWTFPSATEFARRLSADLGTEVMHMCWDEEKDAVQCQIYLAGKPLLEVNENPIGQILRRIS